MPDAPMTFSERLDEADMAVEALANLLNSETSDRLRCESAKWMADALHGRMLDLVAG